MRRTFTTLGLVAAMLLTVALPASAAPNNKNNAGNVIPLTCEGLDTVAVRPNPGRGLPAWDVDSGQHQVAKRFTDSATETWTILEGGEGTVSGSFSNVRDFGAEKGNKDLVECTTGDTFSDTFSLDDGFAGFLNAEFDTEIFAGGQLVNVSGTFTLTVLALITGK